MFNNRSWIDLLVLFFQTYYLEIIPIIFIICCIGIIFGVVNDKRWLAICAIFPIVIFLCCLVAVNLS